MRWRLYNTISSKFINLLPSCIGCERYVNSMNASIEFLCDQTTEQTQALKYMSRRFFSQIQITPTVATYILFASESIYVEFDFA